MASPTCRFVGRQSRLVFRPPSSKLSGLPLQPRFHASSLAALATQVDGDSLHSPASPASPTQNDVLRTLALRLTHRQLLPRVAVLDTLRAHYPSHHIICTGKETGLLKLARAGHATATLDTDAPFYGQRSYKPPSTERSEGRLDDSVDLGRWTYKWQGHDFLIYATEYWVSEYEKHEDHYIIQLRNPDESTTMIGGAGDRSSAIDGLIMAAQQHQSKVTENEIWVFDKGYWRKSGRLWQNVQACRWADVILDGEVKQRLREDVEGFFDRAGQYAEYAVPWKRGVILHGLPGNGKTISIKALMRSLAARSPQPVPTLYVKSMGNSPDKDDVRSVFDKARDNAPCLLVFEDLDSLVSDNVRSFFLNEVDGLEGNDGIMMVGSTNYLDKLDAGISKRPSRFDRKYHFALPSTKEREMYCDTWKAKLSQKSSMELPAGISAAVAGITNGFSYAYMQEAFVSALLSIVQSTDKTSPGSGTQKFDSKASVSDQTLENNVFWKAIQKQVQVLRNELKDSKKSVEDSEKNSVLSDARTRDASSAGFGLSR